MQLDQKKKKDKFLRRQAWNHNDLARRQKQNEIDRARKATQEAKNFVSSDNNIVRPSRNAEGLIQTMEDGITPVMEVVSRFAPDWEAVQRKAKLLKERVKRSAIDTSTRAGRRLIQRMNAKKKKK